MAGDFPLVNDIPGNPRYGQHYRAEGGFDSHGDPGTWHIYHDGAKIFVAAHPQSTSGSTGGTSAPAPAPVVISERPQPITGGSPSAAGSTGGTAAPTAPTPAQTAAQDRAQDIAGTDIARTPGLGQPSAGSTGGTSAPVPTPAQTAAQDRAQDIAGTDIARTAGLAPPSLAPAPAIPSPAAQAAAQNIKQDIAGTDIAMTAGLTPYTVEHGDTLSGIAEKHGVSLSKLEGLNPQIKDPNLILPGETVNLGSGGGASTGFPTTSTYPPPPGAPQAETTAKAELSGWGAPGNVPTDPIKGIMEAGKPETDPLKINNKPHSA